MVLQCSVSVNANAMDSCELSSMNLICHEISCLSSVKVRDDLDVLHKFKLDAKREMLTRHIVG